jgi:hypothetical protein
MAFILFYNACPVSDYLDNGKQMILNQLPIQTHLANGSIKCFVVPAINRIKKGTEVRLYLSALLIT